MRQASSRGFSLLELMVVIIIVGLVAVMAVPSMNAAGLDRRVHENASNIQDLIREARSRAMGRGGAVMVSLENDGHYRSYEIRSDVDGGQNLPLTSCKGTDWATAANLRQAGGADMNSSYDSSNHIGSKIFWVDGTETTRVYLCFTPQGRTFVSKTASFNPVDDDPLPGPLTAAIRVEVRRTNADGTTTYGIVRNVLIPPTGAARIVAGAP